MKRKVIAVIVSITMILCNCGYTFAEEGSIEQVFLVKKSAVMNVWSCMRMKILSIGVSDAEMGEDISCEGNMPEYYTIKAYLVDIETGEVISNVYEKPLHTKAFVKLDERAWDEAEREQRVYLSNDNYGVFAEDTVIVYGDSYVNTWNEADSANGIYTFHNIDEQMDGVKSGCNLAYYYDEELKLVAKAAAVTKSGTESVTVFTVQPALEEVFDYLKIDFNAQDETVTVEYIGDFAFTQCSSLKK